MTNHFPAVSTRDSHVVREYMCDHCEDGNYYQDADVRPAFSADRCRICVREHAYVSQMYYPDKTVDVVFLHDLMCGLIG